MEKCTFCIIEVIFLGFVVSFEGVRVDKEKVKAIQNWPIPTKFSDLQSFHGLASFYRHFVRDFNIIAALFNEIIKKRCGSLESPSQDRNRLGHLKPSRPRDVDYNQNQPSRT
ncbi:Retrovirus-related Pol polyprotein from transposon gypsy, partial [Mucuna pruriens]